MPLNAHAMARLRRHAWHGFWARPVFNPPVGLWIGGVDYTSYLIVDSPQIKNTAYPQNGTFTFRLDGAIGGAIAAIKAEQGVTFNKGGATYAGLIRSITPDDLRPTSEALVVGCQDYTTYLKDEICTGARVAAESDAQRIAWLLQNFDRRGITAYNVQTLYSAMPAQDFTGVSLYDAIKAVLAYSGGSFYVDGAKDLHTFVTETSAAPFALSDSPDGVTSFGFADFQYPQDSVDMRNAVLAIPGLVAPTLADAGTATITTAGGAGQGTLLLISLKPKSASRIRLVGFPGPIKNGSTLSVNPAFAQPTQAGNAAFALVAAPNAAATCVTPGWTELKNFAGDTFTESVWFKAPTTVNEPAPQFTLVAGGVAQLLEFSGVLEVSPLEQFVGARFNVAASSPKSITGTLPQVDVLPGDLILMLTGWGAYGAPGTATFSEVLNNGAVATHVGDTGQDTLATSVSFCYGVTLPAALPTWYTNEASIGIYGRREAAISASGITSQADLDALGAAYLAAHANPIHEAICKVDQPGLAAGQTVAITNALHGLVAQSFRIQAVDVGFHDNVPRFAVQFADSTVDLTTQMGKLQDQIAAIGSKVAAPSTSSLGTLAYVPVTSNQGAITAQVDLSGLTATVTVAAGRRIKIVGSAFPSSTIADDQAVLYIMEGVAQVALAAVHLRVVGQGDSLRAEAILAPTAGSHTYKLQMSRTGTGTITNNAASTTSYIEIEDVGT